MSKTSDVINMLAEGKSTNEIMEATNCSRALISQCRGAINSESNLDNSEILNRVGYESELQDYTAANFNKMGFIDEELEIFVDDSGQSGKEYVMPIGRADLILRDHDENLYIIEFKRDIASDKVVDLAIGQYLTMVKPNIFKYKDMKMVVKGM